MANFFFKNTLYLLTALALGVLVYLIRYWDSMPTLQRLTAAFFVCIVCHLWEEGRLPGGFTQMVTSKLNFTQKNPHFGEAVTGFYVLLLTFVPIFFPTIAFLAMGAMMIGTIEAVAHTAAIKIFHLKGPYSPGMVTAVFVLLPVSSFGITYAVQNHLMTPVTWCFSAFYMIAGLMLAQQIVVRASGMRYRDFLANVATAFSSNRI